MTPKVTVGLLGGDDGGDVGGGDGGGDDVGVVGGRGRKPFTAPYWITYRTSSSGAVSRRPSTVGCSEVSVRGVCLG